MIVYFCGMKIKQKRINKRQPKEVAYHISVVIYMGIMGFVVGAYIMYFVIQLIKN